VVIRLSIISTVMDLLIPQLASKMPYGKIEKSDKGINLILTEQDLVKMFSEGLEKQKVPIPSNAFNIKIENGRVVMSIKVM